MLALMEKGIPFESHYTDLLRFDQHTPEYLALNPSGQIPTMIHDGLVLTESTAIMEYVDDAFEGPPLRPADAWERWNMRRWCKLLDEYYGPSLSMIGWSVFVGPMVRDRDPDELRAALDRIPTPERRRAWEMAIYNLFTEEQLGESRRRVTWAAGQIEEALSHTPWLAGSTYSLADIDGFNMCYALPLSLPEVASDKTTPYLLEWLRKMYERPAVKKTFALGRTQMAERVTYLAR
jgi:glutathione S-transferase/GST-like protein